MKQRLIAFLLCTALCCSALSQATPLPPGAAISAITLGAEDLAFSYAIGGEGFVQIADETFGPFSTTPAPNWSADGRTSYFVTKSGDTWNLHVDGDVAVSLNAPYIRYSVAPTGGSYFAHGSHDGKYVLFHGGESVVMLENANRLSPGTGVGWETWAADGSTIYYTWTMGNSSNLYRGFDVVSEHNNIYAFARSETGPFAYAASDGAEARIYWGERTIGPFEKVNRLALSPDGQSLAYSIGPDRASQELFVDGVSMGSFNDIRNLVSAPGDGAVAFAHGPSETRSVWVDGTEYGPFPTVNSRIEWSPDGETIAFATLEGPSSSELFVYAGDDRYGPYPPVRSFQFAMAWSPDGSKLLYSISEGGLATHYINGESIGVTPGRTGSLSWTTGSSTPGFTMYEASGPSTFVYISGSMRVGALFGDRIAFLDADGIRVVPAGP